MVPALDLRAELSARELCPGTRALNVYSGHRAMSKLRPTLTPRLILTSECEPQTAAGLAKGRVLSEKEMYI